MKVVVKSLILNRRQPQIPSDRLHAATGVPTTREDSAPSGSQAVPSIQRVLLWTTLLFITSSVAWQLFIPPIIGLADQGDFVRLLGPFGFAPQPKGPEHKYEFVTRTFVRDPSYRAPNWEQITSEFIFAEAAFPAAFGFPGGCLLHQ